MLLCADPPPLARVCLQDFTRDVMKIDAIPSKKLDTIKVRHMRVVEQLTQYRLLLLLLLCIRTCLTVVLFQRQHGQLRPCRLADGVLMCCTPLILLVGLAFCPARVSPPAAVLMFVRVGVVDVCQDQVL